MGYHGADGPISLYDGLSHFRINPWGAFLLGQADDYAPPQPKRKTLFTIDADRTVHLKASLSPRERLQLEAMTDPVDEGRYQLDEMKLLTAVEAGQKLEHLIDFLRNGHEAEMTPNVLEWLLQLQRNQQAFEERATAVLIKLNHPDLLGIVQQDKVLAKLTQPLDATTILVRSSQLSRFRKRLKALGYLLS